MVRHINGMCTNVLWAYNPGVNPLSGEDSILKDTRAMNMWT